MATADHALMVHSAARTLDTEIQALQTLGQRLSADGPLHTAFVAACTRLLQTRGKVVVSGIGKSGHIARKIAATLASTGTSAFFMHPAEALHGDLGMIAREDVLLAISFSGEAGELLSILPVTKRLGVPMISVTRDERSSLARLADVALTLGPIQEACPLGLAPTSSTTATLVLGDMLAVALLEARGFTANDFALSHPAGALGRRLLLRVGDVMYTGDRVPYVPSGTSMADALLEMTSKGLGMTAVVDADQRLVGVYTDGDLRRSLAQGFDPAVRVDQVMSKQPFSTHADTLAAELLEQLESRRINGAFVLDDSGRLIGALNLHNLLAAGVV